MSSVVVVCWNGNCESVIELSNNCYISNDYLYFQFQETQELHLRHKKDEHGLESVPDLAHLTYEWITLVAQSRSQYITCQEIFLLHAWFLPTAGEVQQQGEHFG